MFHPLRILGVVIVLSIVNMTGLSAQQFSYSNETLLKVISDIESQTEYRFLYREAQLSGIRLTFSAELPVLMDELSKELTATSVGLKIDEDRKQALLYKSAIRTEDRTASVSGYVLDSETGERLPFSTISWREDGALKGISADRDGSFFTTIRSHTDELTLLVSFVGYQPRQVTLDLRDQNKYAGLGVRLEPEPYSGKEILIQGINFYTASDTVMEGLVRVGTFSPLGEHNSVRSLQMMPAVSMTNAINNGINIRGSASDGFKVLLDGQTVYHQSHLFGLLDAMNPDVLKTSGFYYDITPAQFQAPLGGTLSLLTRTGSLNRISGAGGMSNTAAKATIEGPLIKGRASWLLSGRVSYLDELNWLNNQGLIEYGLDVDRPRDLNYVFADRVNGNLIQRIRRLSTEVVGTDAQFYDLHGKVYFESKGGSQLTLSGYLGHDDAMQSYLRPDLAGQDPFETMNKWDTGNITAGFNSMLSDKLLSMTNTGLSTYSSTYFKQDFPYQLRSDPDRPAVRIDSSVTAPLNLKNDLQDFTFSQTFSATLNNNSSMEFGFSYTDFDVQYTELSLRQTSFLSRRTSQLVDLFHQFDMQIDHLALNVGNRVHYFSNGQYVRWSPRLKAYFLPEQDLSYSFGYSRNYQFIHRLAFYNINSSDFWILSNEDQPPSEVDYFTAGIKLTSVPKTYFQIEAYYKNYRYLRFHELNTGLISNSFKSNEVPWFYDNDGLGRGIEFLMKNRLSPLTITTAYTLSSIRLKNELINNGEYFYPDWDRRHQISMVSELNVSKGLDLFLSWTYGSGNPNRLEIQQLNEPERLDDYSRIDLSISYQTSLSSGTLKGSFSVYNLTYRDNPWYSEVEPIILETRLREVRGYSVSNVFDMGIQPSFNLGIYF